MNTADSATAEMNQAKEELKEVDLQLIVVNPYQPRRHFAQEELEELSQSIKTVGLIHPPVARAKSDGTFELVSGERRFRACQLAGFKTMSLLVRNSSHSISAQAALIENIQRVDLNPLEVAKALRSLIEEFGLDHEQLASQIGKNRSTVVNYLRLLSLPKSIQDGLSAGMTTMGHAKAILSLEGFEKQNLLYEIILRDDLSVREAEEAALRISQKAKRQNLAYVSRNFYLEQLAERLQQSLGTKVSIQGKGKKGKITIDYYNLDDLDRLIALFEG
jgi:ParB family transcriptional regulator, chromosome partitioning protein